MSFQLSTNYSVNESSSLFTITFSEISESDQYITVNLRNEAQESFIRQSLQEPYYMVRRVRYDKESGDTSVQSDWMEVSRQAFKFLDRDGQEVKAYNSNDILNRFLVKKTKK